MGKILLKELVEKHGENIVTFDTEFSFIIAIFRNGKLYTKDGHWVFYYNDGYRKCIGFHYDNELVLEKEIEPIFYYNKVWFIKNPKIK